jgi:hypothetical protein
MRAGPSRFVINIVEGTTVGTFEEFVEFTAVEPDTPAGWTVIDLDPLTICHSEFDFAHRTQHGMLLKMPHLFAHSVFGC